MIRTRFVLSLIFALAAAGAVAAMVMAPQPNGADVARLVQESLEPSADSADSPVNS